MEIRMQKNEFGAEEFTIIRLRPDTDDFDYWIYPADVVEKTVTLLTKSRISFDLVTGNSEHFDMIPLASSSFDNDELERKDAVAIQCGIDSADLDEAVRYINDHDNVERIEVMKRSELPEFDDLMKKSEPPEYDDLMDPSLDEQVRAILKLAKFSDGSYLTNIVPGSEKLNDPESTLSPEIRAVLDEYMRNLLDMSDANRMRAMMKYDEKASFWKLLRLYSKEVQEFILEHATQRYAEELRKEMSVE